MTETMFGELTIDRENGTIWFNSSEYGMCMLRIQNVPKEELMNDPKKKMIDLRWPTDESR